MSENRQSTLIDNVTVPAAGTETFTFAVADQAILNVFFIMTDSVLVGDLSAPEVRLVLSDGTILPTPLTPTVLHPAVRVGTVASVVHQYDVRGLGTIEVSVTNAAAANRQITVSARSYWE